MKKNIFIGFIAIFLMHLSTSICLAEGKIKVVTTIGQITDIIKNIGGPYVEVQGLMGAGVDPHLYKASESDVRKLSNADIIFYNGLHLEAKMEEIFEKMSNRITTVALGEAVPKEMRLDSVNYPGHYDPHIWFDVAFWMMVSEKARNEMIKLDPAHQEYYHQQTASYLENLKKLHEYVQKRALELTKEQRVLVTAHDAFRYFGRAYDFEVVGLQGISTQSEAGTADVKRLADFIAERKIKAVFIESSVPERNIRAVQDAVKSRGWDVKIGGELFSDAMGNEGTFEGTYVGMVTHNMDIIVGALK
ncbi:MAG: zinc ABC transporter substrate-binding protein [Candidatus Omnitrophica bacterium]|nr:zinc ABC transporter substrate-binding protein [Candidatus Omnitrophota bacterium]